MFEHPRQYPQRDRTRQPRPRAVLHPGQVPGSRLSGDFYYGVEVYRIMQ